MNNKQFSQADIQAMSQHYRVNLINSLSGFKSANLVGTVSGSGKTNLAIISSVFHLGANPALMGFINRPHSVERHTLKNILETGSYTLNHVHEDIIESAHQTSARYPLEQSEFDATHLHPYWLKEFTAPFVQESRIRIGLNYVEHQTLLNETVMVIGEIVHVEVPPNSLGDDGLVDIGKIGTVAVSGLDTYHAPQKLKRLSYAKPESWPIVLGE